MRMRTEIQRLTKKREASRRKNRKEEPAGRRAAIFLPEKYAERSVWRAASPFCFFPAAERIRNWNSSILKWKALRNAQIRTFRRFPESILLRRTLWMSPCRHGFSRGNLYRACRDFRTGRIRFHRGSCGCASSYMTEAAALYHEAYADGGYSENTAATAQENYDRAVMRMNVISEVLQGETPTDAAVTVTNLSLLLSNRVIKEDCRLVLHVQPKRQSCFFMKNLSLQ